MDWKWPPMCITTLLVSWGGICSCFERNREKWVVYDIWGRVKLPYILTVFRTSLYFVGVAKNRFSRFDGGKGFRRPVKISDDVIYLGNSDFFQKILWDGGKSPIPILKVIWALSEDEMYKYIFTFSDSIVLAETHTEKIKAFSPPVLSWGLS